jgi:hypothetical protein
MYNINSENNSENENEEKEFDEIKEYDIVKDNKIYKMKIVVKDGKEILIICEQYLINLKLNELMQLTKVIFKDIIQAYNYLLVICENKKIQIKYIKKKKIMRLSLEKHENDSIVITLKYNNSFEYNLNNKKSNKKNSFDMKYLYEIKLNSNCIDRNLYEIFKSINGIIYLVYMDKMKSLIFYDLYRGKNICEIKIKEAIFNIKYCTDTKNKRDLLITMNYSAINLWNINNMECILKLSGISKSSFANFLIIDGNVYIIYSYLYTVLDIVSQKKQKFYKMKIIDLKGNIIKEINDSYTSKIYYIGLYHDIKLNQCFIISCTKDYIKSYNYTKDISHQVYYNNFYQYEPQYEIINPININYVRIISLNKMWDFHSGVLLKEFSDSYKYRCICLYNKNYFMAGIMSEIYIYEVYIGSNVKTIKLKNINSNIYKIKKIALPNIGECFAILALEEQKIIIMKK